MWQGLRRVSGPAVEPVTLEEARRHLRVDVDDDDVLIEALIRAAREHVEGVTRRALISQGLLLTLDAWPGDDRIELPMPPLQGVSAITYTDDRGVSYVMSGADYVVDTRSEPGRVVLSVGAAWPSVVLRPAAAIEVAYTAGYGDDGTDVPQAIRQALLLLVGHLYENREAVTDTRVLQTTPMAFECLLWPWRVMTW